MLFQEIKATDRESDILKVQLVTPPFLEHYQLLGGELRMPCMHLEWCDYAYFCKGGSCAFLCGRKYVWCSQTFSWFSFIIPSRASAWLMCLCIHVYNYITYHQCKSSNHHDQQNDHWSYQHLSGCREKLRQSRKTITQEQQMSDGIEIAWFRMFVLFGSIWVKFLKRPCRILKMSGYQCTNLTQLKTNKTNKTKYWRLRWENSLLTVPYYMKNVCC